MASLGRERMIHWIKQTGPGGIRCACCGPSPKFRKRHKRGAKRSFKAKLKQRITDTLMGMEP